MSNPQWTNGPVLSGRGLVKRYGGQYALAGVDIDIQAGDAVAIVGPSGSGKTSLLHVLAGILRADGGEIHLAGQRVDQLGEKKRSELRRTEFGFVFQSGMLVSELTAEENVALPSLLAGKGGASRSRPAASGWPASAWPARRPAVPANCPAARPSASRSPGRSRTGRR